MTNTQIREALRAIATGGIALDAATEYELEDLGLITTSDAPYAALTDEGQKVLAA